MTEWECRTCGMEWSDTWHAIDHSIRFDASNIWPVYGGADGD